MGIIVGRMLQIPDLQPHQGFKAHQLACLEGKEGLVDHFKQLLINCLIDYGDEIIAAFCGAGFRRIKE